MQTSPPALKVYAVIPAAGHSRRMGQPKLMLPLGGQTVLARLLTALELPEIICRAVVLRADDTALREEALRWGAQVVCPVVDPPDMRASVQAGLAWIQATYQPVADDAWLLMPADHPLLERSVLAQLVQHFARLRPLALVPTYEGRRGHPLLARWETVQELGTLPAEVGLNVWLRQHADQIVECPVESATILCDLDTPADYARLLQQSAVTPTGLGQRDD